MDELVQLPVSLKYAVMEAKPPPNMSLVCSVIISYIYNQLLGSYLQITTLSRSTAGCL